MSAPPNHSTETCPTCGKPLPGGPMGDLCPICALAACSEAGDDPEGPRGSDAPSRLFAVPGHDVLEELGRGTGGLVYRARQHDPPREVALKILLPQHIASAELKARFRSEVVTCAGLDHPGILPLYAVGEHDGMPYFTMKLAAGGTLTSKGAGLAGRWDRIARLMADLADAVHYAHARGIIHRDLKPGNVLFDESGRAFVSDFGLAKFTAAVSDLTQPTSVLGTPAYLPPEAIMQGAEAITSASDIYGLGAILFELLTGRPPHVADTVATLFQRIVDAAPVPPHQIDQSVPRDLSVICLRCLAPEPRERFFSAADLAADLRLWLEGRPITSRPLTVGERAWRWARRNPAVATLSSLLVLGLLGGGGFLLAQNRLLRVTQEDAREQLFRSLLSEARVHTESGRPGQQDKAVEALQRAAEIGQGLALRSAFAAALAQPDLRLERMLPANFTDAETVLDFSPDLTTYLVPLLDRGFALVDAASGKIRHAFREKGRAGAEQFRYSGDGSRALVRYLDGTEEVWDLEQRRLLWSGREAVVALHPNRPLIAVSGDETQLRILDMAEGTTRALTGLREPALALAFSPDGTRLIVISAARASLWNLDDDTPEWTTDRSHSRLSPAWSSTGRYLAVGLEDRERIAVVDARNGAIVQTLLANHWPVDAVRFLARENRLVTLGSDFKLRLWEVASARVLLTVPMPARVLTISSDGRRLAGGAVGFNVGLYSWAPETVLHEWLGSAPIDAPIATVGTSADGQWLVTCDRQRVRLWHADQREEVFAFPFVDDDFPGACLDPQDQALLYSGRASGVFRREVDLDRALEDGLGALGPEEPVGPNRDGLLIGFSANGDWFIEREKIGHVVIWPDGDYREERRSAPSGRWDRPSVSPDGRWVVTMGNPIPDIRLWSADGGSLIGKLPLELHSSATFSPDGQRLLTGDPENYYVWTVPALETIATWQGGVGGSRHDWRSATFSPDGRFVAYQVEGGGIALRESTQWSEVLVLPAVSESAPEVMLWSPDSRRLFLGFYGPRIFEWDLEALRHELGRSGHDW